MVTASIILTYRHIRSIACTTGELHFAYATRTDASQGEMVYKTIVYNPYLDQSQGTSYTRVIVRQGINQSIK